MARKGTIVGHGADNRRYVLQYVVRLDKEFDREAAVELGLSIAHFHDGTECVHFSTDGQAVAGKDAITKLAGQKRKDARA